VGSNVWLNLNKVVMAKDSEASGRNALNRLILADRKKCISVSPLAMPYRAWSFF